MADKNTEIVTGLEQSSNYKETEYDLVKSLLEAANYKESEDNITAVDIKRNGEYKFTVHIRPLSDEDVRFARKKATIYMPNPQGKKLPPIEKDFDNSAFNSWLIYLATTEEDKQKIWGNPALMKARGLTLPVEGVNALLTFGEKRKLSDLVIDQSGQDDEEDNVSQSVSQEEYAKN